jgi:hypothetical protein
MEFQGFNTKETFERSVLLFFLWVSSVRTRFSGDFSGFGSWKFWSKDWKVISWFKKIIVYFFSKLANNHWL